MTRIMIAVKTTEGGRWILPHLRALRARGIEVVVLLPKGEGRLASEVSAITTSDTGVELLRSPFAFRFSPRRGLLTELAALRQLIKAAGVEGVLYHLYATALAIRLSTLGLRLRRIHMVAGPLYLESSVIAAAERLLCRLDSHIICGSRYTFDLYRRLGMKSSRMSVVPYGVDTDRFRPGSPDDRAAARRHLGLPPEGLVAVMVSYVYAPKKLAHRGQAIKGHEVLLQAWDQFHRRHPASMLLLVGSGFDEVGEGHRQLLMRRHHYQAGRNGLLWLDSVHDVRSAYNSADVSISPSLSDNHGAALEASAMGLPCIVSDAGALPEAVAPGTGWIHRAGSPEDLLRCLEEAFNADATGGLRSRGDASRRHILEHFDDRETTQLVVDRVCSETGGDVLQYG